MNVIARTFGFLIVWIIFTGSMFYFKIPELTTEWFNIKLWFGYVYAIGIGAILSAITIFGYEDSSN